MYKYFDGLEKSFVLLASKLAYGDAIGTPEFAKIWDSETKVNIIATGCVGSAHGLKLYTDMVNDEPITKETEVFLIPIDKIAYLMRYGVRSDLLGYTQVNSIMEIVGQMGEVTL